MYEIAPQPSFIKAFIETGRAFLAGTLLTIVIGIPVGVTMGESVLTDRMLLPSVNMFLRAPLTSLVPVLMVLFGMGKQTVILPTTLFAIWIIVLDTRAGVKQNSPPLVEMARFFEANQWVSFRRIYIWAARPEILAGARI